MNTKNIITEEVQKFLNESSIAIGGGDNFTFTQTLQHPKVFFYNYSGFTTDFDVDVVNANITITWKIGFWINDSGIENFIVDIENIDGQYVLELRDKHSDELIRNETKNIKDINWKFDVQDNVTLITNGTLYVKDISFNFKNNQCSVKF